MSYNPRRLFVVSCLALITSAFSFMIRGDISDPLAADFGLSKKVIGEVMGAAFLGMAASMLVFSPLCDGLGMGKVLTLAWFSHLTGILGTIFAKDVAAQGFVQSAMTSFGDLAAKVPLLPSEAGANTNFWVLWLATFLVGAGNGLVEVAINPLAATLYPDNKTHVMNVLHAWWPGGLILSGCLALFLVNPLYGSAAPFANYTLNPADIGLGGYIPALPAWKLKMGLLFVPLALYGLLGLGQKFPETERVQANVSTGTMFLQILRPLFIVWAFCMLLTAGTELGTNQWMESTLKRTAGVSGTLIFIYTSMLMFVLRFFAGPIAHKFSPVGMLFFCSILTTLGLYGLSQANTGLTAFAAATVFGVGITYYWPTMLGVTAERFPKGGALALGLMGCVGNLAISQVLPLMGGIYDSYTVANLPADVRSATVPTASLKEPVKDKDGKVLTEVPVVEEGKLPTWVPPEVAGRIYPAGAGKVNPSAVEALKPAKADDPKPATLVAVEKAEMVGASNALKWTAVMPALLVVIFGLIALVDKLRGGYRAESLVHEAINQPRPQTVTNQWPQDLRR